MGLGDRLPSNLRSAAELVVKVIVAGDEFYAGYVNSLVYTNNYGIKPIFTVDDPFPAELSSHATPSSISGSFTLFLPKGCTLESVGLVPRMFDEGANTMIGAAANTGDIKIYDNATSELVLGVKEFKVVSSTYNLTARSMVVIHVNFVGKYFIEGQSY